MIKTLNYCCFILITLLNEVILIDFYSLALKYDKVKFLTGKKTEQKYTIFQQMAFGK
jgi:hypothetical protein